MCQPELFSLQGRNILVTGATGYLGQSMVKAIAEADACIFVNGRDDQKVNSFVDEVIRLGGDARAATFDVLDAQATKDWFDLHSGLVLHGIVNNAYQGGSGTVKTSSAESYRSSFEIGVIAAQRILTYALGSLRRGVQEKGEASVVNIASMYGVVSPDISVYESESAANPPFYGASKAALIQWSKYAACEFGKENIRFNSISPGPFPSAHVQVKNADFVHKLAKKVPMGRIGNPQEMGGPVVFLLSAASSFVNGANLSVDGGWTCW